jgi:hypothetical protein
MLEVFCFADIPCLIWFLVTPASANLAWGEEFMAVV